MAVAVKSDDIDVFDVAGDSDSWFAELRWSAFTQFFLWLVKKTYNLGGCYKPAQNPIADGHSGAGGIYIIRPYLLKLTRTGHA